MPATARPAVSYLLRIYSAESQPDSAVAVRFLLERIGEPPQRRGFTSFAALVAYLQTELEHRDVIDDPPPTSTD